MLPIWFWRKKERKEQNSKPKKKEQVCSTIYCHRAERERSHEEDAALALGTRASRESPHSEYSAMPSYTTSAKQNHLEDFFFSFPCKTISDNRNVECRRQHGLFFLCLPPQSKICPLPIEYSQEIQDVLIPRCYCAVHQKPKYFLKQRLVAPASINLHFVKHYKIFN